jgi:alanine racemase
VAKNSGVSYGHAYKTKHQTRIVTVPIGYGDGYRRALSNKGSVLIHGKRYPIAGIICMDQFMVDIGQDEAYVGDEVTLIGTDQNETISINDLAQLCDTIAYEILCGFNNRIVRKYSE